MHIESYGKVWGFDDPVIRDMFKSADMVEIEEKVDGSQFSAQVRDGVLLMRSRGAEVYHGNKQFGKAIETLEGLLARNLLVEGWVYRFEYLSQPKHNTLCYNRVPKGYLVLLEVEADGGFLRTDHLRTLAETLGVESAPLLYHGRMPPRDEMDHLMDQESFLGGPKMEGVVIKARDLRHLQDGKVLKAKVVSADFKERHVKAWKETNPTPTDIVQRIGTELNTDARFEKAVQHLRDAGELEMQPRDIGKLMKELQSDLAEEQAESVKQELFDYFWPKIMRIANSGFPQWYKDYLRRLADESEGV